MKILYVVALCVLLAGCATTGAVKPQVIYTPDDDLVVKVEAKCYRVTEIDYKGARAEPDDLAYGTLKEVPCPVRKKETQ